MQAILPLVIGYGLRGGEWQSGRFQHLKDALGSRHALHAGVEAGAQRAQGQVELGRQDQDKEGLLEGELAVEQAQPDLDGDDGRAEGGDHLQHQGREKGHPQHAHGRLAVRR